MVALDQQYIDKLTAIKNDIQESEILQNYLEEEDPSFYEALKEEFEPQLFDLHQEVAQHHPLQLEVFEEELTDPMYEGLLLPRILGFSVLRGSVNEQYKYIRPQEHFKKILMSIVNSSNFELISQRIGQTVEVGFALSSDIWITNLFAEITHKHVLHYLEKYRLSKYRDQRSRHHSYNRYKRQFNSFNFLTANKPTSAAEVQIEFSLIVNFLLYRATLGSDSASSVYDFIKGIIDDPSLAKSQEHLTILMIIAAYFDLQEEDRNAMTARLEDYVNEEEEEFFEALDFLQHSDTIKLKEEDYKRLYLVFEPTNSKQIKPFLATVVEVDEHGFINPEAIELVRQYYNQHPGLSAENEALRTCIYQKFERYMNNLSPKDFHDYFEINKTFTVYMNIFTNEKFNQEVKDISMKYVRKLLKTYTEKRTKDYQDIKKFVSATFLDLGFMDAKGVKDLFKTKRKKKPAKK